jgi:signal peptidase I
VTPLAVYLVLLAALAAVTALKGKWGVFALGFAVWPAWLLGALRLAKPDSRWAKRFYSEERRARARAVLPRRVLAARIAAVPALALVVLAFSTVKLYRIPTAAMEPTLHCPRPAQGCEADEADKVAALRFLGGAKPARGDIVAFKLPPRGAERCGSARDSVYVHRVIGLPGERIEARGGAILVNGERLSQLYAPGSRAGSESFREQQIPEGSYFVLGDNREASCDSHVWGPLSEDRLIAQVVAVYWPPSRAGML